MLMMNNIQANSFSLSLPGSRGQFSPKLPCSERLAFPGQLDSWCPNPWHDANCVTENEPDKQLLACWRYEMMLLRGKSCSQHVLLNMIVLAHTDGLFNLDQAQFAAIRQETFYNPLLWEEVRLIHPFVGTYRLISDRSQQTELVYILMSEISVKKCLSAALNHLSLCNLQLRHWWISCRTHVSARKLRSICIRQMNCSATFLEYRFITAKDIRFHETKRLYFLSQQSVSFPRGRLIVKANKKSVDSRLSRGNG